MTPEQVAKALKFYADADKDHPVYPLVWAAREWVKDKEKNEIIALYK